MDNDLNRQELAEILDMLIMQSKYVRRHLQMPVVTKAFQYEQMLRAIEQYKTNPDHVRNMVKVSKEMYKNYNKLLDNMTFSGKSE